MHFQVKAYRIWVTKKALYRFQQLVWWQILFPPLDKGKGCFSCSKVWCNVITDE